MAKKAFDKIMAGLKDAQAIAAGTADPATYRVHVPATIDVRTIRRRRGLSQQAFADRYGFSAAAVRDWEQGRRAPEAAARSFLLVIDREPDAVDRALAG
ncbi:helix-turn-helix domain-containing protein [Inquilinus limosus]|uniref:Transcriptional regulator n=1 Tax=Inquilinus limosus TaxID=171674 RepID=A0A211ZQD8_9PROT|nr:helix-turn-helix domain-containing protein [Inquilinus limosus]OWJ67459.1 transcriptional regulator [Inquilinus limosus]